MVGVERGPLAGVGRVLGLRGRLSGVGGGWGLRGDEVFGAPVVDGHGAATHSLRSLCLVGLLR